jgi:hypothetical protein
LKEKSTRVWFQTHNKKKPKWRTITLCMILTSMKLTPKSQTFQVHFGRTGKWETTNNLWEKLSVKYSKLGILQTSFAKSGDEMKTQNNRLICKVILSSPCLWAYFHPLSPPHSVVSAKKWNSIHLMQTRFESNYSSCTGRSSENICSTSGGGQEKGKTGWNSVYHQNWWKN